MKIRKTQAEDLDVVLEIYAQARDLMRKTGNPTQWGDSWPPVDLIQSDIQKQKSYVCVKDIEEKAGGTTEKILGVFFLEVAEDPTYAERFTKEAGWKKIVPMVWCTELQALDRELGSFAWSGPWQSVAILESIPMRQISPCGHCSKNWATPIVA